jgi:hypothetical protein
MSKPPPHIQAPPPPPPANNSAAATATSAMGACATKPKTLEGQAPAEAAVSTPKVAPEATPISVEVM